MIRRFHHAPRGRRHPAAYSLIELVTVIAMISAVMSSSTLLFVTMMRAERNTSIAVAEQQTLARLATQFRRDAHQAESVAVTKEMDGSEELTFTAGSAEPTRYRVAADRLERLAPVADGRHREVFRIRHAHWAFVPPADGAKAVTLRLQIPGDTNTTQPASTESPARDWRIEAGLNLTPALPPIAGGES